MQIARISSATRVLGKSQGFLGLPVRDETYDDGSSAMVTAWETTPAELDRINKGAKVELFIMGTVHPPVYIQVGEPPSEIGAELAPMPKIKSAEQWAEELFVVLFRNGYLRFGNKHTEENIKQLLAETIHDAQMDYYTKSL